MMPSQRRVRLLFYVVLAAVITLLFFTSHFRETQVRDSSTIQDFYKKTVNALEQARGGAQNVMGPSKLPTVDQDGDGDLDADDEALAKQMADRLKAAEQKAKDSANAKAPNKPDRPSELVGVGSSADGQKKTGSGDKKSGNSRGEDGEEESEQEHAVEVELNMILKKSPGMYTHDHRIYPLFFPLFFSLSFLSLCFLSFFFFFFVSS
jgi:uncharacterized membrane protein YdfJ with MMPL/SSD domain